MFTRRLSVLAIALVALLAPPAAYASLTATPVTWNVVGLDSNSPTAGPQYFPVGARVCSDVATTSVAVNFVWDSANTFVNLRSGTPSSVTIPSIGAGGCVDAFFELAVTQVAGAYDTTRRYHVTATDLSGTASTPTPRELYVEHLISQSRNGIFDVKFGTSPSSLTSVPAGGAMNLVVGNTYTIQLIGGTATQGYNQFEAFINFPTTIFQILDVSTSYSADNSPYVPNPNDKLYADACGWATDPNSPNYRTCVGGDFKAGGSNVVTTYTIKVISGGGSSETLNTLLYDFSGSSYHYNADYTAGSRIANIIDPSTAGIAKSFSPNPATLNGVSVLTITLTNPNAGALSGYNFVDNLPANLVVASTPGATTSGCGTPTLTANAGASSISFSDGTVAANGSCVINVNVTPTATGTLTNTTNHLFVDTVDTGHQGSASLTVNNSPPPGTGVCNTTLARWNFETGFSTTAPAPTTAIVTASASPGAGVASQTSTQDNTISPAGTGSWRSNGGIATGTPLSTANNDYFEFAIDTTGWSAVKLNFDAYRTNNGPRGVAVYWGTSATPPGAQAFATDVALASATTWTPFSQTFNSGLNPGGLTYFRIYAYNSNNINPGSDFNIDNVVFTGCSAAIAPTIAKSFGPDPIRLNGTSTLTFTLTNTNSVALTAAAFTDSLPSGIQVAATPAAATTCGGTWAPTAGSTSLTFSGGTIPAAGSCTVSVNVTATTTGPHSNVSGFLSTTESGTTTTGVATDSLTALAPAAIDKQFAKSPVLAGGISTLIFTITNPNQNDAISSVAFGDVFPTSPASMVVAAVPNASTAGCGSPAFSPASGSGSISFSGGTIAAGGSCTVSVDVTVPATGSYANTSGNVTFVLNSQTVTGNTAADTLAAVPPSPSLSILKQVSLSSTGPWSTFLPLATGPVYYRFTIENSGDVPLDLVTVADNTLDVSSCNAGFSATPLPVAVAANENHIRTCVVGPVPISSGLHTNTASAAGTYNGNPVTSKDAKATYATAALTLAKSVTETTFTLPGDVLHYSYLVTNSGFAALAAPVTVADDKTTVSCPAVSTVGDLDNFFDPGESLTCTATYTITGSDVAAAAITNTASASADGFTSAPDSRTVPLSTSADVSIVKTLTTSGPFIAGQSISYTLFVENAGPLTATGIQVTDTPTNLTITNVSGSGCSALPCTLASLASGANTTITVTATITAAGAFDNSATATAAQPDPNTTNNTDNIGNGGTAAAAADVSIVKTLTTAGPFEVGQSISYTLFIANAGPSTATNVQVSDTPTNLTITGVSGSGCSALPCTLASLASGSNATITVTAKITAVGAFDNSATVTAAEFDPDTSNNTDSTANGGTAIGHPDFSITKSDGGASVAPGGTVLYTLTYGNSGNVGATGVVITETVPANTTFNSGASTAGWSCSPNNNAGSSCTFAVGSLAVSGGSSLTFAVTAMNPLPAGVTQISNTAIISDDGTNGTDPTPGNNSGSDTTPVTGAPDLSVTKSDGGVSAAPGGTVSYTLTYSNTGNRGASGVVLTETVPANTTFNSGGSTAGWSCSPNNNAGSTCTLAIGSLAASAGGSATFAVTLSNPLPAGVTQISNTATISDDGTNGTDPTPGNNSGSDTTPVTGAPDLSVTKSDGGASAAPGGTVSYTLTYSNTGNRGASGVVLTETVPANTTFNSGASTAGWSCSPNNNAGSPCTLAIGSLAASAGGSATFAVTVDNPVAGGVTQISNTATISDDGTNGTDPTPGNNSGSDTTPLVYADVSLVKTLTTAGPFTEGQSISYTLFVANAGPSTATNIQVTDSPTNLTITGVSGSGCSALPCTLASLASGANTTITVTATITAAGAFDNSATATGTESDPNPGDNTDSTGNGGTAAASADVSIVKTLTTVGPFTAGRSISYTLFVANAGPSTATNIQVTDSPTNLTITGVSGSGCSALPCTLASLASGANATITVTATITAAGAFDNSATATGTESDPNPGNNTDSTGNGGTAAASADVSIVKTLTTVGPFTAGQAITYTLFVANAGPSTATNIQVTDTPTNLTITNVSGSGCAALPCALASLASGANTTITVTATINASGAFDNSATATGTESDPNAGNNTDSTGNNGITGVSADVSVVKTLTTVGPFAAGQSITYTLFVANAGPSTATNIQVTDTPTHLAITNVSGGGCSALPCTIASLASGANTTITVTATITAAGAFDNISTATATEADPTLPNNTDSVGNSGTAAASADLSVVKTLTTAGPFTAGQSITYTILIANAGPSTATNIQVTDSPTNLTITNVTGSGCAALPCTIASLLAGANTTITVTATITGDTFDNSASVSAAETDPNPANNTDSSGNGGSAGGVAAIPALSDWALILFGAMMGLAGIFALRYRG